MPLTRTLVGAGKDGLSGRRDPVVVPGDLWVGVGTPLLFAARAVPNLAGSAVNDLRMHAVVVVVMVVVIMVHRYLVPSLVLLVARHRSSPGSLAAPIRETGLRQSCRKSCASRLQAESGGRRKRSGPVGSSRCRSPRSSKEFRRMTRTTDTCTIVSTLLHNPPLFQQLVDQILD